MATLFENQTADGTSNEYFKGSGDVNLYVTGDLGGGTVSLEAKAPDNTWVPVNMEVNFQSPGFYIMPSAPCILRGKLTGATGASVSLFIEDSEDLRAIADRRA